MEHQVSSSVLLLCLLMLSLFDVSAQQNLGINYGRIADNLPDPTKVVGLLRSINVNEVKLYDADPNVLTAFANTGVEFTVAVGNDNLQTMATSPGAARQWVSQNVQPFIPATRITGITVGNEVLGNNDMTMQRTAVQNAAAYNGNLMQRTAMNQGTPLKPNVPVEVFVFALFNEDMKPGPASERNYGLFFPDGSPVQVPAVGRQ